jgi:hypothetical protein
MKRFNKIFLLLLTTFLVVGLLYSTGKAEDEWGKDDPIKHGWNALDLVLARPIAIAAGIVGSAIFVVSLPFTIPSGDVDEAVDMFITKPFHFSFTREFPDENI